MHEVMHTMKTNLANIKNVLAAWDRPLMERKPKPVDRDEFERAHKAIKSSRYAEIKEGGKVILVHFTSYNTKNIIKFENQNEPTRSRHWWQCWVVSTTLQQAKRTELLRLV